MKPTQLASILDKFADKSLIIFDGFDEFDVAKNDEILKIIKGQKLLHCNVLVTSRPHSSVEIEQFFHTVVQVQGFSEHQADKYVSTILKEKHDTVQVMHFYYKNFQQIDSKFASPMLLLFICILVNGDEIELEQKNVTLGEIYTRLVRSLYRKFTVCKAIGFSYDGFVKVLNHLGKLAWKTLNRKIYHLQKSEIVQDVGEDAFEYGLLIGHEDFNLVGHETADVFVTFLHSSIQEFLGSFYFTLMLSEGIIIDHLIDSQCTSPILMTNPLVLYFCVYFVSRKQDFFVLQKERLYTCCTEFISKELDLIQYNLRDIQIFPALWTENRKRFQNDFGLNILSEALSTCKRLRQISSSATYFLSVLSPYCSMPNLRSIILVDKAVEVLGSFSSLITRSCDDDLSVVIDHPHSGGIDDLLEFCKSRGKNPSLYVVPRTETTDICEFVQGNVRKVYICGDSSLNQRLTALSDIEDCPFLTHLCFMRMAVGKNCGEILSKAIQTQKLKKLSHLGFNGCKFNAFDVSKLFLLNWPSLIHLDLNGSCLDKNITTNMNHTTRIKACLLSQLSTLKLTLGDKDQNREDADDIVGVLFGEVRPNIKHLLLDQISADLCRKIMVLLSAGKLPSLNVMGLSIRGSEDLEKFFDHRATPFLTHLGISKIEWSLSDTRLLAEYVKLQMANKLDISHSSGITGNLSVLLCHSFPSLNSLVLSDCGLNSQGLCSLAQANVEGRLPQLIHLDISENRACELAYLFHDNCKWETLFSLYIVDTGQTPQQLLVASKIASGCLQSLQQLRTAGLTVENLLDKITIPLKHLQRLEVAVKCVQDTGKILQYISTVVDKNLLPALNTVVFNLRIIPLSDVQCDFQSKTLADSIRVMINSIHIFLIDQVVDLFHEDLRQNPTRIAELVVSLDPSIADRISGVLCDANAPVPKPELTADKDSEIVNKMSQSITDCIVDCWTTDPDAASDSEAESDLQSEPQSDPENDPQSKPQSDPEILSGDGSDSKWESETESELENCSWTNYVKPRLKSRIDLPPDREFLRDELESVVDTIVEEIDDSIVDQMSNDLIQNPSRAEQLVASLDPPIADRISGVFPDADPELLESVTKEFRKSMVETLPEMLYDSAKDESLIDPRVLPLVPLFAGKTTTEQGLSATEEYLSLYRQQFDKPGFEDIDPQTWIRMHASAIPSAAQRKLRKRGIRIYSLQKPDSTFMFADLEIPEVEELRTSEQGEVSDYVPQAKKVR